jgi:hypothetical protein
LNTETKINQQRYWNIKDEKYIYSVLSYEGNHNYIRSEWTGLVDIDLQPIYEDEIIHVIGKIDLDIHNFEKEIKKLNSKKISLMEDYSEIKLEFDNQLKVLENRYAKGTINLNEGTIEYNVVVNQ